MNIGDRIQLLKKVDQNSKNLAPPFLKVEWKGWKKKLKSFLVLKQVYNIFNELV
jgi:hypothetical protein